MRITFLGLLVIMLAAVVVTYVVVKSKKNPGDAGASDGQPS